jgi:DNA-binding response OmpR family regulator
MLDRSIKKKEKNQLHLIQRSAKRLQRLINQLLDLSRLETGKMELQVRAGDFVGFLKSVVMAFASLAESKNIDLKFTTDPGLAAPDFPGLYFDSDKIEKIVSNLLSNAFKFTDSGGSVSVKVSREQSESDGQKVDITIADSGKGIPEDRLPFIFDRFYQADPSSTRENEGTGIGLALVKELVELHHGQINLKSRPGEGTTFEILLSLATNQFSDTETLSDTEHSTISMNEEETAKDLESILPSEPLSLDEDETVILIVDDHPDVRRYIREQLRAHFKIVEAENGESGIQSALDIIPDLVISDVMMPKVDGYELCEALKSDQKTSHIPVILLTARAGEEDKLAGLNTGADDYLVKPFNSKELNTRVRNLIEQRQKLRQRYLREGRLRPADIEAPSLDDQFIQNLMCVIEEHLQDENFSVEELSSNMNMGSRHLHRKVRALTNNSPVELIRLIRLQRARQLLEQKAGSVSQIAYQVGFSNLSYFSKSFKLEFGLLPSEIESTKETVAQ